MVELEITPEHDLRLPTVDTSFLPDYKKVEKALEISTRAHAGQTRKSGGPYIDHPIEVTKIIAEEWKLNKKSHKNLLAAGLLHDTLEDTNLTFEDLIREFGTDVANIVEGVSELRSEKQEHEITSDDKKKLDFETVRKVVKGSYLDVNVALTKLADRLHNMRTLGSVPEHKRKSKASETFIFAGLAEALGMWNVKTELEDLAFKYSDPESYEEVKEQIENDPRRSEAFIEFTKTNLERLIGEWHIPADIRVKKPGVYELFKKRKRLAFEGKTTDDKFSEIDDIVSFRIVAHDVSETYKLLNHIHKNLKNIDYPNMDFYIGENRNDNGYSAIHVPINTDIGKYEVALVNRNDEKFNEEGVLSLVRDGMSTEDYKLKLIFTPDNKVLFLPREATGIDIAYALNSRLGAQAEGILVDGETHTLATVVPHAATVEIITAKEPRRVPKAMQFFMYCLPRTRKMIEEQFNQESRSRFILKGKDEMENELSHYGLLDIEDMDNETTDLVLSFGCQTLDDLYYKIGTSAENQRRIIMWLNANLVSKENTGLTSIKLTGKNVPGLLSEVTELIKECNGDILVTVAKVKNGNFTLRFVIKGILKRENDLKEILINDKRFGSVLLV